MKIILEMCKILLLYILTLASNSIRINCEIPSHRNEQAPPIRLRAFNIHSLKILSDLAKNHELNQKLQEAIEYEKMKRKNEKMAREEAKRIRIVQKHLAKLHGGSTFLNDFLVNRFY